MKIILSKQQAHDVRLAEEMDFIRACFYLGFSINYIMDYIDTPVTNSIRKEIVSTATALGMTDDDIVVLRKDGQ